ncbi:MAG: Wzz/FepE/Etk N-terminal domain-containing protein [Candidatus Omnitrophota bacterium]
MENQQYIQEDEFDIRKYINVIIKRKKLILAIFLVSVAAAAIVSLRMPKVYEITSIIQLGSVNELLIKNEEAKAIILNQNFLLFVINELGLKIEVESLQKAIEISDLAGTNFLKIKITYPGIDTALKINDTIINSLIAQGQNMYQGRLAIINEQLKELDTEINNTEGDIAKTKALISGLPNPSDVTQSDVFLKIILLQSGLPNYKSNLTTLKNQRNELKLLLNNSKDFKVFDAPIKPKYPVGPKKKQNVLIAGMLSLMFGVFLAFFMEFWQKGKEGKTK